MRQIVLDTETTGLSYKDGHRIIEIGCIEVVGRRITGNTYHQYINPEFPVDEGAFKVHGISNEFLADYPIFAEVVKDFYDFVKDSELVIHNAPFDLGFLNHELQLYTQQFPQHQQTYKKISTKKNLIDTLVLARQMHTGQKNNLDALCKRYNVNASNRQLHGALLDADLLAKVYLAMTGGQLDLNLSSSTADSKKLAEQYKIDPSIQLPIIEPSADELAQHQEILESIQKT